MRNLILFIQGNPGNGGGLPACNTPNPPPWCDDGSNGPEVPGSIDMWGPWVLLAIVLIAITTVVLNQYNITWKQVWIGFKKAMIKFYGGLQKWGAACPKETRWNG